MELREYLMGAMAEAARSKEDPTLDSVDDAVVSTASDYMDKSFRLHAASVLNQWTETVDEDLESGETLADRLLALLVAAVDEDGDHELDETEQEMLEAVLAAAKDYLLSQGVAPDDVTDLLDNWTEDAAIRVRDALAAALPDGDEADDELSRFAFDEDSTASVFDAAYKNVLAFEHGKKVVKRRRISGTPRRMTPKQKAALRKARALANSAIAKRWRAISIKNRLKAGVGMKRKFV